jgi:hypothetical protein
MKTIEMSRRTSSLQPFFADLYGFFWVKS